MYIYLPVPSSEQIQKKQEKEKMEMRKTKQGRVRRRDGPPKACKGFQYHCPKSIEEVEVASVYYIRWRWFLFLRPMGEFIEEI